MAFIVSRLDEETIVMVETETTGAFSKSELEIKPDPERAIYNSVDQISKMSRTIAAGIIPSLREVRASNFEMVFGTKIDGAGAVMVSQRPEDGQFRITLRWAMGPPPARPGS
jgi:hypothetical protein